MPSHRVDFNRKTVTVQQRAGNRSSSGIFVRATSRSNETDDDFGLAQSVDSKRSSGHRLGIFARSVFGLTIFFSASFSCTGQDADDPRWLHRLLEHATDTAVAERSIGLDPALRKGISVNADILMSSFCVGAESLRRCRSALTETFLLAELRRWLTQLESGDPRIRVIAANMARAVGHDLNEVGWPSEIASGVGLIILPPDAAAAKVLVSTASGSIDLGHSVTRLLMVPGTYRITLERDGAPSTSGMVDATARGRNTLNIAASTSSTGGASFGRLDPPDASFCFNTGTVTFQGPVTMFNWGRATFSESPSEKLRQLAPTATTAAIVLSLDDQARVCQGACRHSLGVAFAEAIATWKVGCERCDPNAMSVLKFDGTTWVDGRIANRIRAGDQALLDLRKAANTDGTRSVAPSVVPTKTAVYGFEQLTGNATLTSAACALSDNFQVSWIAAVKASACGQSWAHTPRIAPILKLRIDGTSCGPSRDFLACGLPNHGIEISFETDRFTLQGSQPPIDIGNRSSLLPAIDLRTVILHEVGHWFGVPHFESTGLVGADVMAEAYGDGQTCVSGVSLMMLNNATDLRWSYRVTEGRGLRRPKGRNALRTR